MKKKIIFLLSLLVLTSCKFPKTNNNKTTPSNNIEPTPSESSFNTPTSEVTPTPSLTVNPTPSKETITPSISGNITPTPTEIINSPSPSDDEIDDIIDESFLDEKALYEDFFNPNNKIEITLNFTNESITHLAEYGDPGSNNSNFYKNEMYHPCDVVISINNKTSIYFEVGARMKGNTSRNPYFVNSEGYFADRLCHFKLSFDESFTSSDDNDYYSHVWTNEAKLNAREDRKFASMKKIDLKWNKNYDESFTRELYCLDAFKNEGLMAQRANLVYLTINTENDSISQPFIAYEVIDKQMIKKHFDNKIDRDGNLYKVSWGGDLSNLDEWRFGIESVNYKPTYDLKTNKKNPDHSLIKKLINNVSHTNNEYLDEYNRYFNNDDAKRLIDEVIDVDEFLRFSAMSYVAGLPDDLRNNSNNYYLYFDGSNKAHFITYDDDRCFGILQDWPIHMEYRSINDNYKAGNNDERQTCFLIWRTCISGKQSMPVIEEYQQKYVQYCIEYANKYLNVNRFEEFTNQFYYSSKNINVGGGVNMTFKEYAETKMETIN